MTYTIAATGHRLGLRVGGYHPSLAWRMERIAESALSMLAPDRVLSGMALGWDQAVAGAAARLGIPWVAAIPFEGQERRWPPESQSLYRELLASASRVEVTGHLDLGVGMAMRLRDQYLVEQSDALLALWDGAPRGGTAMTIRMAQPYGARRPVVNLWPAWIDETVK